MKKGELLEAQKYADKQVVDTRNYVDRSDRQNQLMLDREIRNREELIGGWTELVLIAFLVLINPVIVLL